MAGNRTVKRSLEILEIISKAENGISLKEIVDELIIPKTSAYDIVRELILGGMVVEVRGEVNVYKIGLKAFQIGNEFLRDTDLISVGKPIVNAMAESMNKTAFLAVLSEGFVTYLYKYEPKTSIITTSNVGTKNPIHCTSLGKAILSGMTESEQRYELSYSNFAKRTERTIVSTEVLIEKLKEYKTLGYAVDDREIEDHTLCIGAPIFNHEGKVIAGLSVSGLYSADRDVEQEGQLIKTAAEEISKNLGYRGHL